MENKEGAQYCKNCGTPLNTPKTIKKTIQKDSVKNRSSLKKANQVKGNNNTLIICLTIIICLGIIVGAFLFLSTDIFNSNDNSDNNQTSINQTSKNNTINSDSKSSNNEMTFVDASNLMKGSSDTVIRNTFDESDANGDGVLTGNEISKFKSLADLTDRTADSSNTEHVEASEQGAGDGTTKTRYCTTHGRVAVGSDNRCPYCEAEGLDSRTVKGSTEYI